MVSKRAQIFFGEEPPLVKAHFQCVADPYSSSNKKGYVNLGTAENHLMDDILRQKISQMDLMNVSFHYDSPQGGKELRQAYSEYLHHFFQIKDVPLKNIGISSGASSLIEMLSFVLCDEGDEILTVAPLYNGFIHDTEARFKAKLLVSHCLSPLGFDFQVLENDIKKSDRIKVLLLNHPHNPTGYLFKPDDIRSLILLAKKYNLEIISDEIYGKTDYLSSSFQSFLNSQFNELGYREHIHHVYGMAKDFCLSGFKVGFFVSYNDRVAQAMTQSCYFHTVSTLTQKMAFNVLGDLKWCEEFFKTNHQRIRQVSNYLLVEFKKINIDVFPAEAGIFLWCNFAEKYQIHTFEQELELYQRFFNEGHFNIIPGQVFKSKSPGWFRICFAQPMENIEEFIRRLSEIK